MASAETVEGLKSLITCSICFHEFKGRDPRSLPCLHAYCRSCIQRVYDTTLADGRHGVDHIICPTCQTESVLPNGIVSALPRYFQASQVTDILNTIQTNQRPSDKPAPALPESNAASDLRTDNCTSCEAPGSVSVEYCFTCVQSLCEGCLKIHEHNSRFDGHVRIPIEGISLEVFTCREHAKLIASFCTDCWKPTCKRCEVTSHKTHEIKEFRNFTRDTRIVLTDIQQQICSLDTDLISVDLAQLDFEQHMQSVADHVCDHKTKLIKEIEAQETLVLAGLYSISEEMQKKYADTKIRVQRTKDIVLELEKEMGQIVDPLKIGLEIGVEGGEKIVDKIREKIPSRKEHFLPQQRKYSFTPGTKNIFFGHLSDRENWGKNTATQNNIYDAQIQESPRQRDILSKDANPGAETKEPMSIPRTPGSSAQSLLRTTIKTSTNVQSVCFQTDGKIVAITGSTWISSSQLNAFKHQGELVALPFDATSVKKPYCLASHYGSSSLAVAGWNKSGYCINTWFHLSQNTWNSPFQQDIPCEPWTMAFTAGIEIVIGTNKRILKYQSNGRVLAFDEQTTHFCRHLVVDSTGRIIITDGQLVHVYNSRAKPMFAFPGSGAQSSPKKMQLNGICVDSRNNIVVSDGESRAVLLFSSGGKFLKELVSVKTVGTPQVIALYRDKFLLISVSNKQLLLFEVNTNL